MDHRMRVTSALIYLLLLFFTQVYTFIPGVDGPVIHQEALEGGNTTLLCDTSVDTSADEFMLLVWYKNNVPIFSYDARNDHEWSSDSFNTGGRLKADVVSQPTAITISALRQDDQALFHCRVDFLVSPTRNIGVNLTVIVLPSQPFFLYEDGNKVEENRIRPFHEGDTLVLICLVIGGRPPPRISWYSGETLVDASDGASDIPNVRENELYLPLTRENAADLSCRASNTKLAPALIANLQIELYLPAYNVSIHWVGGTDGETLTVGKPALVQCTALGSYPQPDLSWWLDHKHLTQHSNQTWNSKLRRSVSFLEVTPSVVDNGATLACVATNPAMAPSRGSKADVIKLNVTYSPIVEISRLGEGSLNSVVELDSLHLECEVRANPPVHRFRWYFNDSKIIPGNIWGEQTSSRKLVIEEISKNHAGSYSCAATNSVGETRAEPLSVTVYYPPECSGPGVTLIKETIKCNVRALPGPDTFFWHVQPLGLDVQHLTTGSPLLPLAQITGPLSGTIKVSCEASNGISNQYKACQRTFSLELLRPPQPKQCDLAYELGEFHMRCIPVENATYYEVSVWRMSTSNSSLVLERRGSMGYGARQEPLAQGVEGGIPMSTGSWLVRGTLGSLRPADEAGAAACNRYGCSAPLLLRPTEYLLEATEPPWWHFFLERDVGISLGAVVLVVVFAVSSALVVRLVRRPRLKPPAPVIQVMQLDDVTNYLDSISAADTQNGRPSKTPH
ncbi:hemicentin-2-like isoform X2 [Plodia interpunctella]|uniref:hemicentin-2-like isoform X2 n=1 Tax=Plodia interpunctella TaxID=58824 RepID=UPI002368EF8D|nr:hemicentin-2-like isoform X2 [Plodia interpunctella]